MRNNSLFKILSIKPDFLALSCIISVFLTVVLCSRNLRYFRFFPSKIVTSIYKIFDPFLIQLIAVMIIFYFSLKLVKKYKDYRRYIILLLLFSVILFPLTHFIVSSFLKPVFNYNRPVSMAEQFIIGTAIELESKELEKYSNIISDDIKEFLRSYEAKILFELVNERRKKDSVKVSKEDLENDIKNLNMNNYEKKRILDFYEVCLENWNTYSRDRILGKFILCSKKILINSTDFMREPWLTYFVKNIFRKKSKKLGEYWHDACPSDFALRSAMILLLALSLVAQEKDVRNSLFKSKLNLLFFIFINIFLFLFVIFSRVYGFRHSFFDIGVGILYGTLLYFLFIILVLTLNWKLNILFLTLYAFVVVPLSIIYAQEVNKLLLPSFIILIILSICASFLRYATITSSR